MLLMLQSPELPGIGLPVLCFEILPGTIKNVIVFIPNRLVDHGFGCRHSSREGLLQRPPPLVSTLIENANWQTVTQTLPTDTFAYVLVSYSIRN